MRNRACRYNWPRTRPLAHHLRGKHTMSANTAPTLDNGTKLALERTWLAHERTLMAWVRTAASLISFGFTIYKFFAFEEGKGAHVGAGLLTPREFGLVMIATGIIALTLATINHRQNVRRLNAEFGPTPTSVAGAVSALIAILGLVTFIATLMRA